MYDALSTGKTYAADRIERLETVALNRGWTEDDLIQPHRILKIQMKPGQRWVEGNRFLSKLKQAWRPVDKSAADV